MSMSPQTLGILIGGIVPAIAFGFANLFAKSSTEQGINSAAYITIIGVTVLLTGLVITLITKQFDVNLRSGIYAGAVGVMWSLGVVGIIVALNQFNTPIAQITPLFNLNTLLTVGFGLWLFAEWKQVHVPTLLVGSVLIVAGGILVAKA